MGSCLKAEGFMFYRLVHENFDGSVLREKKTTLVSSGQIRRWEATKASAMDLNSLAEILSSC